LELSELKYSVVIPVFNSEKFVSETINRTECFFKKKELSYEIILVNDGSSDDSWGVIEELARKHPAITAINLLRNYGQHNANLCGFRHASGEWIITMDDDLQNPPEEIIKLIEKSKNGHPLVIGKFKQKQHASHRKVGSRLIQLINRRIFHTPNSIVLSNFRLIHKSVVDRVCEYKTAYPYVPGLVVMFSHNIANVDVEHNPRMDSKSNYNGIRIAKLVCTILFNYSSFPLRIMTIAGAGFAIISFLLGSLYLYKSLVFGTATPGWPTLVVLLSIFSSIIISMLAMIGEYLVRLVNQTSFSESYVIREIVGDNE